ncbi:helix-turn-helix domain-containing protein [candidate division KSB1 bacterium]|nr:helix-turn-helix domain-containing protein [candidate division KSB1 bacterium]
MTNKEIILQSVRFIENNLQNEINVLDVANSVHYSLYHFIRLFAHVTGLSPKAYMQQRRLSEALKKLRNKETKIIEIAFDYQFNSHEAFSRAFKKQFGINPRQVRAGRAPSNLSLTAAIGADYIYQSEKVRNEPPQLIELPRLVLSGISFFISDDVKINSLSREWGQFMHEVDMMNNRILPERFYQVQYWSQSQDLGGLYFFIGAEVKDINTVHPQFVLKILPKGRYLRFIHKGLANKVGYTYKYIYNQVLPETDYKLTKPFSFEFYGEKCLGPDNPQSESEIYIPVE